MLTLAASSDMLCQLQKWRKQYGDIFSLRLGNRYAIVISSYEVTTTTTITTTTTTTTIYFIHANGKLKLSFDLIH